MNASETKNPIVSNPEMKRNTSSRLLLSKSIHNLNETASKSLQNVTLNLTQNIAPIIEELETKSLEALVIDSRAELKRYLQLLDASKTRSSRANAEKSIGFQERRAIKFLLASIDKNGDGIAATNEIEAYEERAKESVSKTLELLLNVGLVASVVLTISFPASIFEINASDSSAAFFAEPVILAFKLVYYCCIICDACLSLMLIYLSLRLYTYMGFWISSSQGKLRYLDHAPMNFICVGSQWNLALLVFALPFAGAVNVGPIAGVISLILCVLFSSYNLYTDVIYGNKADKLGLAEVREIIKHDTLVKTHAFDAVFT